MTTPRIGFYGDDFTGATDALATATQAGLRTMLFLGVPTPDELAAAGPLDCLGIAGAARSMTNAAMIEALEPAARFFTQAKVPVVHYKTCSTFDSAPDVGNIGVAVSVLRRAVPGAFVPIVGGQPNLGRYCVFANLFAVAQAGGPVHRIDRHPTMSRHPVTPMDEADLRLHLACQGLARIASVDCTRYALPAAELDALLTRVLAEEPDAVLFDVGHADHLPIVGRLIWQHARSAPLLAVGPSGVIQALAAHWQQVGEIAPPDAAPCIAPAEGPVLVIAGSLSPVTAQQIQSSQSYERVPIDAALLARRDSPYTNGLLRRILGLLHEGRSVIVHTAPVEWSGSAAPTTIPARDLAPACGLLLHAAIEAVALRRVGIAGGDTSSLALGALEAWGLSYLGALSPGVPLCRVHSRASTLDGVELILKGGQMGPPDVFERLLHGG